MPSRTCSKNETTESAKWSNLTTMVNCNEKAQVLALNNPRNLNDGCRNKAPIKNPRSRAHAAHFSAETKDCTTDHGTLSRAAAITRAIPAPAMT